MSPPLQPLLNIHTDASGGKEPFAEKLHISIINGTNHMNNTMDGPLNDDDDDAMTYQVSPTPLHHARPIRIITIGAGASGINLVRTLRLTLKNLPFTHVVYEKNPEIGGTWFENRYPGCRCDVPSHNYQFSWRPNPEWSNFFAPAREIQQYLCRICDEEDMWKDIRMGYKVVESRWVEGKGKWVVKVEEMTSGRVFEDEGDFLLDAGGILNNWAWPDIPGREEYRGQMVHTAAWPEDFNYDDKVVAVIGNGASGVQVLPSVLPRVKKLYHPIRTRTWIIPPRVATMKMGAAAPVINQIEMDPSENFTAAQIERFKTDPEFNATLAKAVEVDSDLKFALSLVDGSPQQVWAAAKCREFMAMMLGGDPKLCAALIPTFPIGCRRLTPAPGYLEAMRDPKMNLVTDGIRRFVPEGIELVTGEVLEVDAIICATGFDYSFCPAFPVYGRRGNLQEIWKREAPKSYMSVGVAGMPNYFKFLGPNAPIAHGDVLTLSEHIATYIASLIRKCQTEGILAIVPSDDAVADYFEHVSAFMPRTAWAGGCRSWYKNGDERAPVTGLHPGSRMHFIRMLEGFRGEDYEYVYVGGRKGRGNRFAYLGNGFTGREVETMRAMKMGG